MTERGRRKTRTGTVVGTKTDKTCIVQIERSFAHPLYKKVVRRRNRISVHDEKNTCKVGDVILVMETRPLSKTKRWRYVETVREAR